MALQFIRIGGGVMEVQIESEREFQDKVWIQQYEVMLKFIEEHGHQKFPYDKTSKNYTIEYRKLHSWASFQRKQFKLGLLPQWRTNLLNKANFIWDPYEHYWTTMYGKLVDFKNEFGHLNPSRLEGDYIELGEWIAKQKLRKAKLTEDRIKLLEDIGLYWGVKRTKWDIQYNKLKQYFLETGRNTIKRNLEVEFSQDPLRPLYRFYSKQLAHYRRGRLSKEKIRLLEEIGVNFNFRNEQLENAFEKGINSLSKLIEEDGTDELHKNLSRIKHLTRWTYRIRAIKNELPQDKVDRLNNIKFPWHFNNDEWEKQYLALKNFHEKFNHFRITENLDEGLYYWTKYQIKAYNNTPGFIISEEQIKKLNEINFEWDFSETLWKANYRLLKNYKEKYGNCNVAKINRNFNLWGWCRKMRNTKDQLTPEKIALLDEIGFEW